MECNFTRSIPKETWALYKTYWTWPENLTGFDWTEPMSKAEFTTKLEKILNNKFPIIKRKFKSLKEDDGDSVSVMQWNVLAQGKSHFVLNFSNIQNINFQTDQLNKQNFRDKYLLGDVLQSSVCLRT